MSGFTIDVEFDADLFDKTSLESLSDQIRPAIATSINLAARDAVRALRAATQTAFDRPTPFTVDGFGYMPAHAGADPTAVVYIKDIQAQFLELEVFGGVREIGDYATSSMGIFIPEEDAALDAYGNMPRDYIADEEAAGAVWAVIGAKHTESLIMHTPGGGIEFLAAAIPEAHYDARFDFFGIVEAAVEKALG